MPQPSDTETSCQRALRILREAQQRYASALAQFHELEAALGSQDNVWQVMHRLRNLGIEIENIPRRRRRIAGYILRTPHQLADQILAGQLGFHVPHTQQ